MSTRALVVLIAVLAAGARLAAHDFWLAAAPWVVAEPRRLVVTANVGEHFPRADSPTTADRIDVWRVIGADGELTMPREFHMEGQSVAAAVTLPAPGSYLGVMTIKAREIEMTGQEFTDYLREEGLDQIISTRKASGQDSAPALERYARYAKLVVRNGGGDGAHLTRPIGLKAEMVPTRDPSSLRPGDSLTVRLLVDGRPVEGALITARPAARSPGGRIDVRTDAEGRVTLALPESGPWLLRTVHMAKPQEAGSPPADWESYWVTLAFHVTEG
jgi:uncharacterized GH25 family protein